jgi:hypothetical protein
MEAVWSHLILASDAGEARKLALETMMGGPLDDVDDKVVVESLAALSVED